MTRSPAARVTAGGQHHPVPGGMIETAENLRREYGISRADQDELALRSQQRAAHAVQQGWFTEEIVPVTVSGRKGETVVAQDEHPRPDTTAEQLAALRPVMGKADPEATVTAGNASGQNDAAAACLVTTAATAERLGLRPLVRLVSFARTGVAAKTMGIGPVRATGAALERAGLSLSDLDLIELNEAFAAQVLACTRELGLTATDHEERINVRLRHLPRPPRGRDRRAHPCDAGAPYAAHGGAVRAGDDVHRRRAGTGRRLRAGGVTPYATTP